MSQPRAQFFLNATVHAALPAYRTVELIGTGTPAFAGGGTASSVTGLCTAVKFVQNNNTVEVGAWPYLNSFDDREEITLTGVFRFVSFQAKAVRFSLLLLQVLKSLAIRRCSPGTLNPALQLSQ